MYFQILILIYLGETIISDENTIIFQTVGVKIGNQLYGMNKKSWRDKNE